MFLEMGFRKKENKKWNACYYRYISTCEVGFSNAYNPKSPSRFDFVLSSLTILKRYYKLKSDIYKKGVFNVSTLKKVLWVFLSRITTYTNTYVNQRFLEWQRWLWMKFVHKCFGELQRSLSSLFVASINLHYMI